MTVHWIERFFYAPSRFQKFLALLLAPFGTLYCLFMYGRYRTTKPQSLGVPVIGIGNLTVGGSGKTPLVTALAQKYEGSGIVLRGYGRVSQGLHVVCDGKSILCDVRQSGDEAMIYAQKLPNHVVIVAKDRIEGIQKAKELGCSVVFLDDAYSKHHIRKFDILIDVQTPNAFCLPAGPYRERHWSGKQALHVKEGREFTRRVSVRDAKARMVLITAIARPERLDAFLPKGVIAKHYFPDHHFFDKEHIEKLLHQSGAESILVTYKDYVKLEAFNLPLSLLDLELDIETALLQEIDDYLNP